MRYDEVPHAGINELTQWVRKQGQQVLSLRTWPLAGQWAAHIELDGMPPLHAWMKPHRTGFTITSVPEEPTCPTCSGAMPVLSRLQMAEEHLAEQKVFSGAY